MPIEIRKFQGEAKVAEGIEALVLEGEERGDFGRSVLDKGKVKYTPRQFTEMAFTSGNCFYAIDTDTDKIVGAVSYYDFIPKKLMERAKKNSRLNLDRSEAYLGIVFVSYAARKHGLGQMLTKACCDDARERGFRSAVAKTWISDLPDKTNHASLQTLRSMGFVELYRGPDPDRAKGVDSIYLRCKL